MVLDAHGPGGDQHAFEEAVRVAFEVDAVLEGAGFAFVDVDRHQARAGLGAHDAPLAPGREAGAAQAAQAGRFHRGDHAVDIALRRRRTGAAAVAARGAVLPPGRDSPRARAHRDLPACTAAHTSRVVGAAPASGRPRPPAPARSGRRRARPARARRRRGWPAASPAFIARRPSRTTGRRTRARSARRARLRLPCTMSK
jgi:hypothetical protein